MTDNNGFTNGRLSNHHYQGDGSANIVGYPSARLTVVLDLDATLINSFAGSEMARVSLSAHDPASFFMIQTDQPDGMV